MPSDESGQPAQRDTGLRGWKVVKPPPSLTRAMGTSFHMQEDLRDLCKCGDRRKVRTAGCLPSVCSGDGDGKIWRLLMLMLFFWYWQLHNRFPDSMDGDVFIDRLTGRELQNWCRPTRRGQTGRLDDVQTFWKRPRCGGPQHAYRQAAVIALTVFSISVTDSLTFEKVKLPPPHSRAQCSHNRWVGWSSVSDDFEIQGSRVFPPMSGRHIKVSHHRCVTGPPREAHHLHWVVTSNRKVS